MLVLWSVKVVWGQNFPKMEVPECFLGLVAVDMKELVTERNYRKFKVEDDNSPQLQTSRLNHR